MSFFAKYFTESFGKEVSYFYVTKSKSEWFMDILQDKQILF
jgi:hypothetical protein